MSRTWFGDFAGFGETGTVFSVGFLTIEDRRKRNVVGGSADGFRSVLERDFGGHVYQETTLRFEAFGLSRRV